VYFSFADRLCPKCLALFFKRAVKSNRLAPKSAANRYWPPRCYFGQQGRALRRNKRRIRINARQSGVKIKLAARHDQLALTQERGYPCAQSKT
jgi:hypothetical protein